MKERISSLDFLRGFAIVAILLLHNLEHFDYYYLPDKSSEWLTVLDKRIWETLFFLFAGKAYSIFALLFGVTFYIQQNNQRKIGKDFRGKFAWRLLLLFGFGLLNSCFFQGDILSIYAILGFSLIAVANFSNKTILVIVFILLLQPVEWLKAIYLIYTEPESLPNPNSWQYFGRMKEYIPYDSFFDTVWGNLTNGKLAVYNWTWEVGRVFQIPALFMLGMLLGRKKSFVRNIQNTKLWLKILVCSSVIFAACFFVKRAVSEDDIIWFRSFDIIVNTWSGVAFTFIWISLLLELFWHTKLSVFLNQFSPLGRMSLTNYVIQSVLGSFIYYGFGLGLYLYTGASISLLIGVALALAQWFFSRYWLSHHSRGPLEQLWHNLTWMWHKIS